MFKKNPFLKMMSFFLLGATLTLLMGFIYNQDTEAFKTSTTPIEKVKTTEKVVAIACNVYEGEKELESMLKTLNTHNTKISFFIGGVWAKNNISTIKEMKNNGHDIQNHGYYHKAPTKLSREDNLKEIKLTEDILEKELNIKTTLFEPPYGDFDEYTQRIVNEAGHTLVTFSIDTIDWREDASPEKLVSRVQKKLAPGGIILMHPKEVTAKSLDSILTYLKSEGYKIVTVKEILNIN